MDQGEQELHRQDIGKLDLFCRELWWGGSELVTGAQHPIPLVTAPPHKRFNTGLPFVRFISPRGCSLQLEESLWESTELHRWEVGRAKVDPSHCQIAG